MSRKRRVIIYKPSTYGAGDGFDLGDGHVERIHRGFMPNSTIQFLASLTPESVSGADMEVVTVDEHIDNGQGMELIRSSSKDTILAIAGTQCHQFPRGLDVAGYALEHGLRHVVIGGPQIMTCDTSQFHDLGASFALSEAEGIWPEILEDAVRGELAPVYGSAKRYTGELSDSPVLKPPSQKMLQRYVLPMLGIYPARGCPYTCNFCSVIKIAGRKVRTEPVSTTISSLKAARAAGVKIVMFTSDNFNKSGSAPALLQAMIDEKINMPFMVQCDTQVVKQPELIALLGKAGCYQMFLGVEAFNREILLAAHKTQNHPKAYSEIIRMCAEAGIATHFSNIIGFPTQTEADILEHLDTLIELDPNVASFYILTPIPGTEQYDDFMSKGWVTAPSLDHMDAVHPTWSHPNISHKDLARLLFLCYRKFNSVSKICKNLAFQSQWMKMRANLVGCVGLSAFSKVCGILQREPMSAGFRRIKFDTGMDYRHLRKKHFGVEKIPLPQSLPLSAADEALNRQAVLTA